MEHLEISIGEPSKKDKPENPIENLAERVLRKIKKKAPLSTDVFARNGVTEIELENPDRIVYLLDGEDASLFYRMNDWKTSNPKKSLLDMMDDFETDKNSDAIARILFDYPFPDFILKYSDEEDGQELLKRIRKRRNFETLLLMSGLVIEHEDDIDHNNTYVKIWAPFNLLCEEAHKLRIKMPLDTSKLPDIQIKSYVPQCFGCITRRFTRQIDFRKESAVFKKEKLRQYRGAEAKKRWSDIVLTFWTGAKRNYLTHHIIINSNQIQMEGHDENGKSDLQKQRIRSLAIKKLLKEGTYSEFFPLHDGPPYEESVDQNPTNLRAKLFKTWVKSVSNQPLEDIRDYFGERLTLYFAWLGFYTTWLTVAATLGIITVLYGLIETVRTNGFSHGIEGISKIWDNALTFPFALIMSIWATFFLETWKRYNSALVYDWDTSDFEKEEQPRPEFVGTSVRISPITFKKEIHFPFPERFKKVFISTTVVVISICIVTVTIGVLLKFSKVWIKVGIWSNVVTSLVNLATVLILNTCYGKIAEFLTNFENHRTSTSYQDSLTLKTYLFDFVNFYSALFYILLFKKLLLRDENQDACEYHSCITELTTQLAIILIGKQTFGQIQENLIPWALSKYHRASAEQEYQLLKQKYSESSRPSGEIPQWVNDAKLVAVRDEVHSEYQEMVVQYGFISLFTAAFPLAPFFAWINNISEIRMDALKFIQSLQRPVGYQAQDLGMWEQILNFISLLAVITNATIIAFHSNWMRDVFMDYVGDNEEKLLAARLGFIIAFEHFVFLIKILFAYFIPDVPKSVRIAIERERYMARVALEDYDPAADELPESHICEHFFTKEGDLVIPKSDPFPPVTVMLQNFQDKSTKLACDM
ncbi:hypothetical protein G9A89_009433 [Geosiphon pyriformis]|nr:hypothetical protein G9A89_009433 [Geosiphon pyriformis]